MSTRTLASTRGLLLGLTSLGLLCFVASLASAQPGRGGPRPVIERVEPTSGPPGSTIVVVGRGLNAVTRLRVGDTVVPVLERQPFRLVGQLPPSLSGGPVVLEARGQEFMGPFFRVTPALLPPTVTALRPASGPPGSEVVVEGTGFSTNIAQNVVTLAGRPVVVRVATPNELRLILPQDAASGPFAIRVGRGPTVETPPFVVALGTAITAFDPPVGPRGATVTIRGTGFTDDRRRAFVSFGRMRAQVLSATETELVVRVPPRAVTGPVLVDIRGGGRATSTEEFRVQALPIIARVTPPAGAPGTIVSVDGRHFGSDPSAVSVTVAGRPQVVRAVGPTRVQFEVVAGTPTGPVVLAVNGLAAADTPVFEGTGSLRVDSFAPSSGPPGTVVTLQGAGFSPIPEQNVVTLAGQPAAVVAVGPGQLQVTVPASRSGPFEVRVGPTAVRTGQPFTISQPPFISSFQPPSASPGDRVTILGSNFGSNPRLVSATIAGVAMPVVSVRDDQLIVEVPPNGRTDRITVNVRMQGGTVTGTPLHVDARRSVSSLSPERGFFSAEVTIRGQGFPPGEILARFHGARPIPVRRLSPVEVRVNVPPDAASGPVTLMLPGGRALQAGSFTVLPTPAGAAITSIEPVCSRPGCVVVLHGYGFRGARAQARMRFLGEPVRINELTPTRITVQLPARTGNGRFELTLPGDRQPSAISPPFLIAR